MEVASNALVSPFWRTGVRYASRGCAAKQRHPKTYAYVAVPSGTC